MKRPFYVCLLIVVIKNDHVSMQIKKTSKKLLKTLVKFCTGIFSESLRDNSSSGFLVLRHFSTKPFLLSPLLSSLFISVSLHLLSLFLLSPLSLTLSLLLSLHSTRALQGQGMT